jgi:hypothetical protein
MSWQFLAALVIMGAACGDPYTQPACYNGPGCGQDDVPPVGEITAPASGAVFQCPFQVAVTATDNIGVQGVDFFLDGFQVNSERVTARPYRQLVDPTFGSGACEGLRDITVVVHDVADNADTVDLQVYYQRPTRRPWPCPVTDTLCGGGV